MPQDSLKVAWKTWEEEIRLFLHGTTLSSCSPVAVIAGLVLSTINHSDVIVSGAATTYTWLKASCGFFNACRLVPYSK